jgi:hypothetical protein
MNKQKETVSKEEKHIAIKEMLTLNFPIFPFVGNTLLGIVFALLVILFQFVSIGLQSPLFDVGVG